MADKLICWEALDTTDKAVAQAERLYERTQAPDERIPWAWIERAIGRRRKWRPGHWAAHLLLAGEAETNTLEGFATCVYISDYAGYLSYIGVEPASRGRGIGTKLIQYGVKLLDADACAEGAELPFVIWESKPPLAHDSEAISAWQARLGLWRRTGAMWVSGLTMHAKNYNRRKAPPIRLALFLRPVAKPVVDFDADYLRQIVAGLLSEVYDAEPGDALFADTLPVDCVPQLKPVDEALALRED